MIRANPLPEATLPQMLVRHANERPDAKALRQRDAHSGEWRSRTWRDYLEEALDLAGGLRAIDVMAGARIAILASNRAEWLVVQMAASIVGAVSVGVYPTSSRDEVAYILDHGEVGLVVVEDAEQLGKLPTGDALNAIVVALDIATAQKAGITDYLELGARGRAWRQAHPAVLEAAIAEQTLDVVSLMIFTSGSTGGPKGALLSYRNIRAAAFGLVECLGFAADSEILSYLPLCHVAEQAMSVFGPIYGGSCVAFGGGIPGLVADLRDIRPTYFSGVPRIWEKLQAILATEFATGGSLASPEGAAALEFGKSLAFLPQADWTPEQKRQADQFEQLIWSRARALIGMDRLRIATSGAASLTPEVIAFFRGLGAPLVELYGMTEACSMMTLQQSRIIPGTVGEPVGAVQLQLAPDGEILVAGDNVFVGYYKNPEATALTKVDGWLHTGDLGAIVEGQLRIVGRKKDIIITSGGKNVAATEIETLMKASPLIEECIVVGEGRNYLAGLVQLAVSEAELPLALSDPANEQRIASEIARLNERVARVYRIRRAYLLPRKLAYARGELTATLKIRRFAIYANYAEEIDAIYAGKIGFGVEEKRE